MKLGGIHGPPCHTPLTFSEILRFDAVTSVDEEDGVQSDFLEMTLIVAAVAVVILIFAD
jgi:hypothetical protein